MMNVNLLFQIIRYDFDGDAIAVLGFLIVSDPVTVLKKLIHDVKGNIFPYLMNLEF